MNPLLHALGGYPLAAIQDLKASSPMGPVHDFSIGDPSSQPRRFVRQALIDGIPEVSQYPTAAGLPELRAAIAGWVRRRFGVDVDPDTEVLPTRAARRRSSTCRSRSRPAQRRRAVHHVGRSRLPGLRAAARCSPGGERPRRRSPMTDGWRSTSRGSTQTGWTAPAIAWLNYPHNPTGAVADLSDYRTALATARAHGFVLASDECYADIYPPDDARPRRCCRLPR
jgi:aspartate/methionine/tyrosine aminotransferase